MASFDRSHTSSNWRFIVTIALSCIISEIKRDIGRIAMFSYPTCIPVGILPKGLCRKLQWCGYPTMIMFNRVDTIPACDGRMDGHLATAPRVGAMHIHRALKSRNRSVVSKI